MLFNSQTKSRNTLFPFASSEFPAGLASQSKPKAVFHSPLPVLLYFKSMSAFFWEKLVSIHHVLPYVKTKTTFVFSSQILNETIDYDCMGELFTL